MTKISSLYTTSSHAIAKTVTGFLSEALVQSWDSPSGTDAVLSEHHFGNVTGKGKEIVVPVLS
jgi:hypothetical protein